MSLESHRRYLGFVPGEPWPDWALACQAGRVPFPPATVGFAGSRSLPDEAESLVRRVVRGAAAAGRSLATGCAVGADAFALRAAVDLRAAEQLTVFSAFGPYGFGAWRDSAIGPVLNAAKAGAKVRWFAGGPEAVDLRARLAARTFALVSFLACRPGSSLVVFLAKPEARGGSWLAVRAAMGRGVRVVVYPVGFPASELPSPGGGGQWAPVSLGGLPGGVMWRPGEQPEAPTAAQAKAAGWRFRHLGRCRPSALWPPELLARDD